MACNTLPYKIAAARGAHRVRAGFNAVRIRVILGGPEDPARYAELAAAVDAHCPVLDLFRNPVPVERTLLSTS